MHTLPSTFKTFVIEDSMRFLYHMVCFILTISGLQQIICHVDTDTVSCDLYSVMTITSSTYGRYDGTTCTGGHGQYHGGFPCIMDSTNWVKQKCENKQTCSINPTSIGTDPCENYNKYMTVWYTCSDIDECASNPCQNGGICIDMINEYTCTCDTGYAGTNCEENINECASSPCQHGGTCTDGINGYTCACVQGYTGNNCEENIDECGSNPCQHGGTCTDVINGYTCNCDPAYKGTDCSESNDLFDINYTLEEHQSTHMSLKALLVMSRLNCARICTLNHDCYGFEYNAIDNTCQMISAISTRAFGKVNYYVKQF